MSWSNFLKLIEIGKGSFGTAWLVHDSKIDRLLVIKEMNISGVGIRYTYGSLIRKFFEIF